jgi:hypothetical protein
MFVKIKSGNKTISKKAKLISDANEQAIGLMFYKSGDILMDVGKEGIWNAAIHTWFCRPMAIIWLDKKKRIVDSVYAKPWRIYAPKKPARYVFESTSFKGKIRQGSRFFF